MNKKNLLTSTTLFTLASDYTSIIWLILNLLIKMIFLHGPFDIINSLWIYICLWYLNWASFYFEAYGIQQYIGHMRTSAYVDPSAITLAAIQIVFITLYIPCLATVLRFSLIPLQTILLHQDQDKMQPLGLC